MPQIKDSTRQERRRRILGAVEECLLEKGLHETTVADIAARAGLAPASLYVHFPNKQALVVAVAETAMLGRVEELDLPGDPLEPAALVARLIRGAAGQRPRLGVLLQMFGEAGHDEELRSALADAIARQMHPLFRRSLTHWLPASSGPPGKDVRAKRMTPVLVSLTVGYFVQLTVLADFDTDAYCRTAELVVRAAIGSSEPASESRERP